MPHQVTTPYLHGCGHDDVLEAQWESLVGDIDAKFPACRKMRVVVDVSLSMNGLPLQVAIGLGLLIAEAGPLGMRVLTFSHEPQWHVLDKTWSLKKKVRSVQGANWGGSTDYIKTHERTFYPPSSLTWPATICNILQ